MNNRTYIIAEVGVNHNGDLNTALELVNQAANAGADCVKFQTFKSNRIVSKNSPKAKYQLSVTDPAESQAEMLKKLELDFNSYKVLIQRCKDNNVDFLSTPYNKEDVDFLEELDVEGYKIASGQLTELPFLEYVAKKNKTMIISTGMATMADVFTAVETIRATGNSDIFVLQCTTNYPSHIEDANIRAMQSIKLACEVRVGYSDHVAQNFACYAAVALGAQIIEKHFTLDKEMNGPDHSSSLNPIEFNELVFGIREIEKSLGTGLKILSTSEKENLYGMKRSLVVNFDLSAGTILKEEHIGFKRPANGLEPNMINAVIGKELIIDMQADEPIKYKSVKWD